MGTRVAVHRHEEKAGPTWLWSDWPVSNSSIAVQSLQVQDWPVCLILTKNVSVAS